MAAQRDSLEVRADTAPVAWRRVEHAAVGALDAIATAILVVRGDGELVHANRSAQAQLTSGGALRERCGRIIGVLDGGRLASLIATAAGDALRQRHAVVLRDSAGDPRIVRAQALPQADGEDLVLLQLEDRTPTLPSAALLCACYDLTGAEARIALALLAGERLRDAAARLSIGISTARSQLAAVFAKTGVTRQSELVRSLAALGDPLG